MTQTAPQATINCLNMGGTSFFQSIKVKDPGKYDKHGQAVPQTGIADLAIFHPGVVMPGDTIKITGYNAIFTVAEIVENRNHAGSFNDPMLKINSFWRLTVTFTPISNQ